jgi:hypothetical protein
MHYNAELLWSRFNETLNLAQGLVGTNSSCPAVQTAAWTIETAAWTIGE